MRTVEMKRPTSDNHTAVFENHEIAHDLADLGQRSRKKRSVASVGRDQSMDPLGVGQDRFTRAHGRPPGSTRSSVERPQLLALLAPERYRRERRGWQAPTPVSGRHKNPCRTSGSLSAVPPEINLEARNASPGTSAKLYRSAH